MVRTLPQPTNHQQICNSEWGPAYNPSAEQEEADRRAAYEAKVPHGYIAPGNKYANSPTIRLWVTSHLHQPHEYGATVEDGRHTGGPFTVDVPVDMRVHEVRRVIYEAGGILPGLQRLVYAGTRMEDPQRTLQHYGVGYWHSRFPHWPIVVRRY